MLPFSKTPARSSKTPLNLKSRTAPSNVEGFTTSVAKRRKYILASSEKHTLSQCCRMPKEVEAFFASTHNIDHKIIWADFDSNIAWIVVGRRLFKWEISNVNASFTASKLDSPHTTFYSLPEECNNGCVIIFYDGPVLGLTIVSISITGIMRCWAKCENEMGARNMPELSFSLPPGVQVTSIANLGGTSGLVVCTNSDENYKVMFDRRGFNVLVRPFTKQTGFLGGLGGFLGFKNNPLESNEEQETSDFKSDAYVRSGKVITGFQSPSSYSDKTCFIQRGSILSKYILNDRGEKKEWDFNLELKIAEALNGRSDTSEVIICDIKRFDTPDEEEELIILSAVVNKAAPRGTPFDLSLCCLRTDTQPPKVFNAFTLPITPHLDADNSKLSITDDNVVYVHHPVGSSIGVLALNIPSIINNRYEIITSFDLDGVGVNSLIGNGVSGDTVLYFTAQKGVLVARVKENNNEKTNAFIEKEKSVSKTEHLISSHKSFQGKENEQVVEKFEVPDVYIHDARPLDIENWKSCEESLSQAFRLFANKNVEGARKQVEGFIDSPHIGEIVIAVSASIMNVKPQMGKSWADDKIDSMSQSACQLVHYTLEDKNKRHIEYLNMLHSLQIWERLHGLRLPLLEHGEKLAGAIALCSHQSQLYTDAVNKDKSMVLLEAMKLCLESRSLEKNGVPFSSEDLSRAGLSIQDVFYSQITGVHELCFFLNVAADKKRSIILGDRDKFPDNTIFNITMEVNEALIQLLDLAYKYREDYNEQYEIGDHDFIHVDRNELKTWSDSSKLRMIVAQQIDFSISGLRKKVNLKGFCYEEDEQEILTEVIKLTSLLLDSYKRQLERLHRVFGAHGHAEIINNLREEYSRVKSSILSRLTSCAMQVIDSLNEKSVISLVETLEACFREEREIDSSGKWVEKFVHDIMLNNEHHLEMESMVRLSEAFPNEMGREHLQALMDKYENAGFPQFVFEWYIKNRLSSVTLSQPPSHRDKLTEFLDDPKYDSLAWIHALRYDNFEHASNTILKVVRSGSHPLSNMKSMLSIGKLSLLTSQNTMAYPSSSVNNDSLSEFNEWLSFISCQEQLNSLVSNIASPNSYLDPFDQINECCNIIKNPKLVVSKLLRKVNGIKRYTAKELEEEVINLLGSSHVPDYSETFENIINTLKGNNFYGDLVDEMYDSDFLSAIVELLIPRSCATIAITIIINLKDLFTRNNSDRLNELSEKISSFWEAVLLCDVENGKFVRLGEERNSGICSDVKIKSLITDDAHAVLLYDVLVNRKESLNFLDKKLLSSLVKKINLQNSPSEKIIQDAYGLSIQ